MLGKIEGRRRGHQRMRQLDGITDAMDMNLDKLQGLVRDRGGWQAPVHAPPARATLYGQVQHPGDPRQTDTQTSASTPRDPRHTHSLFLKVRRGLVALLKGPRAPVHPRPSLLGLRCHPPALRGKDVLQGLAGPCIPHRRGSPLSPTPDPRGQDSSPVPSQVL